jgi:hypothetical protein
MRDVGEDGYQYNRNKRTTVGGATVTDDVSTISSLNRRCRKGGNNTTSADVRGNGTSETEDVAVEDLNQQVEGGEGDAAGNSKQEELYVKPSSLIIFVDVVSSSGNEIPDSILAF